MSTLEVVIEHAPQGDGVDGWIVYVKRGNRRFQVGGLAAIQDTLNEAEWFAQQVREIIGADGEGRNGPGNARLLEISTLALKHLGDTVTEVTRLRNALREVARVEARTVGEASSALQRMRDLAQRTIGKYAK